MSATADNQPTATLPKSLRVPFGSPDFYVSKLEEALEVVDGKPLPFSILVERLCTIWSDPDCQSVLERLEQLVLPVVLLPQGATMTPVLRRLPEDRQESLAQVLAELAASADRLPARDRDRADRAVSRLSRLLTIERAWTVVEPWFGDRRAFRRSVVVRVLLEHRAPPPLAGEVVEQHRVTQDRGLLKLIGRNPHVAALLEEGDVLAALAVPVQDRHLGTIKCADGTEWPVVIRDTNTRYWWMRAIEAYLIGGHVPGEATAFKHPMEFAWAVGRQSCRAALPTLRRVLERYQTDPEFVWRCMRAFERAGEAADVERIRVLAQAIIEAERVSYSSAAAA